jgi:hypothetical protein
MVVPFTVSTAPPSLSEHKIITCSRQAPLEQEVPEGHVISVYRALWLLSQYASVSVLLSLQASYLVIVPSAALPAIKVSWPPSLSVQAGLAVQAPLPKMHQKPRGHDNFALM